MSVRRRHIVLLLLAASVAVGFAVHSPGEQPLGQGTEVATSDDVAAGPSADSGLGGVSGQPDSANVSTATTAPSATSAAPAPPTLSPAARQDGDGATPSDAEPTAPRTVPAGGAGSATPAGGAAPAPITVSPVGEGEATAAADDGDQSVTVMNTAELELFHLTNELRANPAGALARQAPMPACIHDDFYQIEVDPVTGHPQPVPALTLDERVSLEMARPWSQEMDRIDAASELHRPDQIDFFHSIDVFPRVIGENVAWAAGYDEAQVAGVHFTNWRESASVHYCLMMSPVYTHLGVGHHTGAEKAWATQNFYAR